MSTGRKLQPGDSATTDYNGNGITQVKILARQDKTISQSGILFQVTPKLKNSGDDAWIDADWFEQAPNAELGVIDSICHENDGCPTEMAVLQRQWRMMRDALQPFANIGCWFFARPQVEDETPVITFEILNGQLSSITRGQFKAAFSALDP